jgi:acetyl-CoA carboxylase biotin carboxyl carrier protein
LAESTGAWLDAVRRIVSAVRASDVTEFFIERGDFSLSLRLGRAQPAGPVLADRPASQTDGHLHPINAPLTGIFFRAPSPSARPYVNEGDWVEVDAVVGLIETMKVFNEVTADRSGRVLGFQAQSGQLVYAGDPLVLLEPGERSVAAPQEV